MARAGHWGIAAALTLAVAATKPAASQDFYAGKTLTLLAGAPAGAEQDKLARLVAKHLGAHIPGKPVITVDNRSANGGLDALNAFFNDAPKDGTALHLVMPGMTLLQALRAPQVHYNTAALGYIGNLSKSPHVLATWWVTGFKTIDDGRRREMVLGAVGNTSPGALYPDIVNGLLRTRFKINGSYRRDADVDEAMENTEIGGRVVSWGALVANQPGWIAQKRLGLLFQAGLARHPALPDTPLLTELVTGERERALMTFVSRDAEHARAIAVAPESPAEVMGILRTAFDAMARDPAFLDEAKAGRLDLAPTDGQSAALAVAAELRTPRDMIDRARAMLEEHFQ